VTTARESDRTPVQYGVVAGETSHQDDSSEARARAFGKVVDLLVGFRRIVRRGSVRLWGDDWFEGGCPTIVRDRLVAARDVAMEMERIPSEGDDPFELATFCDLADLVESSASLEALLRGLALSPDGLIANLRTLEDLRRKLAAGRVVSDSEGVVLDELHLRLRERLSGVRRETKVAGTAGRATAAGVGTMPAATPDQPADPSRDGSRSGVRSTEAAEPKPVAAERTQATAALFDDGEALSGLSGVASAAAEGFAAAETDLATPVLFEKDGDEGASIAASSEGGDGPADGFSETRSTDVLFDDGGGDGRESEGDAGLGDTLSAVPTGAESTDVLFAEMDDRLEANRVRERVLDGAATPVGLVHVEREDFQVLRDLRSEIIGAAEAAYRTSSEISCPVWQSVLETGWFSNRAEAYGLAEVATFHAIIEVYLERLKNGDDGDALKTYLADCELAKLLLRLRELFIRLRV